MERRFGREISRVYGDAMIGGIFAGDPRKLSVQGEQITPKP